MVYSDGERYVTTTRRFSIAQFDGLRRLDELPIRHLNDSVESVRYFVSKITRLVG